MRFSNFTLAACCLSVGQIVAGFQIGKNSAQKIVALPSQKHFTYSTSPSSLSAKFRLDSDYDEEEDGVQIAVKSSDLRNGDAVSSPTATFGAEAVPEEQRPANEYLNLIASPFFDWADKPSGSKEFFIRLSVLYAITFAAICWPISGATFTMDGYLAHRFLSSNVGAFGFILMFCLRLYSGWGYIGSRLQSKEIEYEETGWYDGDFEMKSEAEIARDLLLYRSQVRPVVERTKTFSLATAALFVASGVGLNVMFSIKPIFNEYNPDMLERLVYDDRIANVAADQSNGIPTYCNSRYYSAVANGGQGCK
mmetsp:Transcript_26337/g.40249  ORF Transcript_26337/g.40249 Transcript_26337/m.40249 type:complete len:308 (+) Transcript_26337:96-1019(+)|eukprot:CAMPEP_0194074892 /NCGR_PEP_ID=MMETSP0149-20130528/1938_1 /TAXON_ID=122233 /ORGANISM="Chaetoceros debilis, Strain MM31A-1" /LENGTH=307 /DNA_ID=CAMNT_0038755193 /DNA_START=65 /DNA_END=988 /DNA_ORIENTATION=-